MFLSLPPPQDPYGERQEERFCLLVKSNCGARSGRRRVRGRPAARASMASRKTSPGKSRLRWLHWHPRSQGLTSGTKWPRGRRWELSWWKNIAPRCTLLERGFGAHPLPKLNSLKTSRYRWFCLLSLPKGSFRLC